MIIDIISLFLMVLGIVMMFSASLGILRFDDVFMRLHSSAKASTGGAITTLIGVILRTGLETVSGKIIVVISLIVITGPILSHALARAAYIKGGFAAEVPFIDYRSDKHDKRAKKNRGSSQDGD
ncbi:MAG: monovalent cation/H(+) antiporter subunit G [Thermoplasmatota archaeon]